MDTYREQTIRIAYGREFPAMNVEAMLEATEKLTWWEYLVASPPAFWQDYPLIDLAGYERVKENTPNDEIVDKDIWSWYSLEILASYLIVYFLPFIYCGVLFFFERRQQKKLMSRNKEVIQEKDLPLAQPTRDPDVVEEENR